jgi:hypothetical protein
MHFIRDVTSSVKYETTVLRLPTVSTLNAEAAEMSPRNNKARWLVGKLFILAALSVMCGCIVKHGIMMCFAGKAGGHVMY